MTPSISVSIVSHGHGKMVGRLVENLLICQEVERIYLTRNIFENSQLPSDERILEFDNEKPAGYGKNHNRICSRVKSPFFCVLNPDINFKENPFPNLLENFMDERVALVGPKIVDPEGREEDSARREPTFSGLVLKALGRNNGTYPVAERGGVLRPDWIAGMFLLLRCEAFQKIGGFDEKYFLYYEDVDLGKRLRLAGYEICQDRRVSVIHEARRESRRNWLYARWHLASMARYLFKYRGW